MEPDSAAGGALAQEEDRLGAPPKRPRLTRLRAAQRRLAFARSLLGGNPNVSAMGLLSLDVVELVGTFVAAEVPEWAEAEIQGAVDCELAGMVYLRTPAIAEMFERAMAQAQTMMVDPPTFSKSLLGGESVQEILENFLAMPSAQLLSGMEAMQQAIDGGGGIGGGGIGGVSGEAVPGVRFALEFVQELLRERDRAELEPKKKNKKLEEDRAEKEKEAREAAAKAAEVEAKFHAVLDAADKGTLLQSLLKMQKDEGSFFVKRYEDLCFTFAKKVYLKTPAVTERLDRAKAAAVKMVSASNSVRQTLPTSLVPWVGRRS